MLSEEIIHVQPLAAEEKKKPVMRVLQLTPILYSRDDAAAALGISTSSFDRYVAPSVPRHYVGGTLVRYSHMDLVHFAERSRTELPPM
jgi:hypothetical protein